MAFQSTPLCEGRPAREREPEPEVKFQSTPLCEGRQIPFRLTNATSLFQSTPLCEGRRTRQIMAGMDVRFNPRPSARGDP